jgi:hypothetical protein
VDEGEYVGVVFPGDMLTSDGDAILTGAWLHPVSNNKPTKKSREWGVGCFFMMQISSLQDGGFTDCTNEDL